jgi:putative transposase
LFSQGGVVAQEHHAPSFSILREIRRRPRVIGAFPDGQSALNLAAAKLRAV